MYAKYIYIKKDNKKMPKYDLQIMSWRAIDVIDPVARINVIDHE